MKYWRKMGNKVTIENKDGSETVLTGRQFKAFSTSMGKSTGSELLFTLVKKIPYISPYFKEDKQ
jgi:hypothetical protein